MSEPTKSTAGWWLYYLIAALAGVLAGLALYAWAAG
jgi:hypothetical protein